MTAEEERYVNAFDYEVRQLTHCAQRLAKWNHLPPRDAYAFLECFLMHARGLLEFLAFPEKAKYVRASQCLSGWKQSLTLHKEMKRIDAEIVHLGEARRNLDAPPQPWELQDFRPLLFEVQRFYGELNSSKFAFPPETATVLTEWGAKEKSPETDILGWPTVGASRAQMHTTNPLEVDFDVYFWSAIR